MIHFNELTLDGKEPVYMQIAGYVKRQLLLGRVSPGDRLPSRRDIAAQLSVNPNTVQKAFKLMEEEGFVHTSGNQGSVIHADAELMARIEEELTRGLVLSFISSAKEINLSFKKVIDLVSEHWEQP
ncbi:GntR family transcriptional regulator [Paenibacillus soyae]|uniref:GntR family transcriptional regulator n=1 Tax=Paenibacillus soyae TaxID=2969249 RepID=A0A9X2MXC0_9BACL|nr:GntR family transcriptional regulator [Paenibacillus soyae]